MTYIVYEKTIHVLFGSMYIRTELKNDKELKEYLFNHRENLFNIEIFKMSKKSEIKFEIKIN